MRKGNTRRPTGEKIRLPLHGRNAPKNQPPSEAAFQFSNQKERISVRSSVARVCVTILEDPAFDFALRKVEVLNWSRSS